MKTIQLISYVFIGMFIALVSVAETGDISVELDFNSAYVWRGIVLNKGPVIQPSVDVSLPLGIGLNVWGNMDIDDNDGTVKAGEFSEIDITISKEFLSGPVTWSVGYIEYLFPYQGDTYATTEGTREVQISAALSSAYGLSISLTGYYDIDEVKDLYAALALEYSTKLPGNLDLGAGTAIAYAGKDMSAGDSSGMDDFNVSVGISSSITDNIVLSGHVTYTGTLDKDVLPDQDVDVYAGIGIGVTL